MTLRLPDHWLWDFWFAVSGDEVHVFYLQAPRRLGDPELRHRNARIGHAVSRDLRSWEVLPNPIDPGPPGSFDDLATWTGCVVSVEDRWYLYYTGRSTVDERQRVGVAVSDDLLTWEKREQAFASDPRWYEANDWRDPWAVRGDDGTWHMLLCARGVEGPADGRGVIGHATADGPLDWKAGPPLSAPGEFSQLEVPQLLRLGDRWRIAFCAGAGDHSAARLARPGTVAEGGTHLLVADRPDEPFGDYRPDGDRFLLGDPACRYYAGRFLRHAGRWHFFAWHQYDADGSFVGELSDPFGVEITASGAVRVAPPETHR